MFYAGDYTFFVRICNAFDPAFNITLNVERCHHLNYFSRDLSSPGERVVVVKDVPDPGNGKLYQIEGGDSLAIPMYFTDESLILSIPGAVAPEITYKISIGTKIKCLPNTNMGGPLDGTYDESRSDENNSIYAGGAWDIKTAAQNGWVLTLKKFGPDPEDDDVVIGPDPPPAP